MLEGWFSRWGMSPSIRVDVGDVASGSTLFSSAMSRDAVRSELTAASQEIFHTGGTGSAPTAPVTVYLVAPPNDSAIESQWPKGDKAGRATAHVYRPADGKGWMAVFQSLNAGAPGDFLVGDWVVRVFPGSKFNAFPLGKVGARDRSYSYKGYQYQTMYDATVAHTMNDADITRAAASLLRSDDSAGAVNGWGANYIVATFVSESARVINTWGINLMILDMIGTSDVPGGVLTWGLITQKELHPMARGGGWEKVNERIALEAGLTMRWLQANRSEQGKQVGVTTWPTSGHEPVAGSRKAMKAETALRATLRRRLSTIEQEFGFERG
jgi:hypothetical protein